MNRVGEWLTMVATVRSWGCERHRCTHQRQWSSDVVHSFRDCDGRFGGCDAPDR